MMEKLPIRQAEDGSVSATRMDEDKIALVVTTDRREESICRNRGGSMTPERIAELRWAARRRTEDDYLEECLDEIERLHARIDRTVEHVLYEPCDCWGGFSEQDSGFVQCLACRVKDALTP